MDNSQLSLLIEEAQVSVGKRGTGSITNLEKGEVLTLACFGWLSKKVEAMVSRKLAAPIWAVAAGLLVNVLWQIAERFLGL